MVFVKTHKTGGTTITNMILRHGSKSAKIPSLPKIPQPSSGGFKHGYFIDHVFLQNQFSNATLYEVNISTVWIIMTLQFVTYTPL